VISKRLHFVGRC